MKKKLLFAIFLSSIYATSGCTSHNTQKPDLIPMVIVNDTLYIDTGLESQIKRWCGTMDGEITSSVPQNEKPTKNNQSNFGTGYEYQYGEADTIDLLINGKWCIFATEEKAASMSTEK